MIEKSTIIARDTTTINRVAVKDSTALNGKIDSIIIEEYAVDRSKLTTDCQNDLQNIHGNKKRNDTSQTESIPPKRKTKIYGVSLSDSRLSVIDSLYKNMTLHTTTKSEIKQKTPIQTTAGGKIIYVLIGITLLLFVGYLNWKNAVQ